MNKRPVSIAVIGGLFIGLGTFVILANVFWLVHGQGLLHGMHGGAGSQESGVRGGMSASEHRDLIWVFGTEALAVVSGVFLLRGRNWARWLLVAWMGFHVALSAFHPGHELALHGLITAVVVYFLFWAPASEFFRGGERAGEEI